MYKTDTGQFVERYTAPEGCGAKTRPSSYAQTLQRGAAVLHGGAVSLQAPATPPLIARQQRKGDGTQPLPVFFAFLMVTHGTELPVKKVVPAHGTGVHKTAPSLSDTKDRRVLLQCPGLGGVAVLLWSHRPTNALALFRARSAPETQT